jgi:hypothetical protein
MPFTPAHSAIVLPFLRIRPTLVSATTLVIGSLSPDFEYFLKMSVNSVYSHTLLGVLYFDIPITIVLAFLFHLIIKKNFIENLPAFFQRRLVDLKTSDFKNYFKKNFLVVSLCAGLGALSHIFWDAFTHNDGYFAQRISLYKQVVVPFDGVRYPLFYALQHFSTFAGMSILFLYFIFLKPNKELIVTRINLWYWVLVIIISVTILSLRLTFPITEQQLGNSIVSAISAFIISISILGFIKFDSRTING